MILFLISLRLLICLCIIRCLIPQQNNILPIGLVRELESLSLFETFGEIEIFVTSFSWFMVVTFLVSCFSLNISYLQFGYAV